MVRQVYIFLFLVLCGSAVSGQRSFDRTFADCGVEGSITLYDYGAGKWITSDIHDSFRETLPASTFKILHTLIVLEEETVAGAETVIPWPGSTDTVKYGYRPEIYRDLSLRQAFRTSAGWAYVEQAKRIGKDAYRHYLEAADYGNGDLSIDDPDFWNFGNFGVTPVNQIETLIGVYEESLPFRKPSFAVLKELMVEERTDDYVLRAKTGWTREGGVNTGWWVGYVESDENVWFFATRLQMDREDSPANFGDCRKEVTRAVLKEVGVL